MRLAGYDNSIDGNVQRSGCSIASFELGTSTSVRESESEPDDTRWLPFPRRISIRLAELRSRSEETEPFSHILFSVEDLLLRKPGRIVPLVFEIIEEEGVRARFG